MNILWAIIIGLIVGALAKLIMPGRDGGNILMTILLGIAGSLVATFLGRAAGWYREGQGAGILASIVGAIILLFVYRALRGRRHYPRSGCRFTIRPVSGSIAGRRAIGARGSAIVRG